MVSLFTKDTMEPFSAESAGDSLMGIATLTNEKNIQYLNITKMRYTSYAQNERQQKPSQIQYYQRLCIPDRREAGNYCIFEY